MRTFFLICILACALFRAEGLMADDAPPGALPDQGMTPGAVVAGVDVKALCAKGYLSNYRPQVTGAASANIKWHVNRTWRTMGT